MFSIIYMEGVSGPMNFYFSNLYIKNQEYSKNLFNVFHPHISLYYERIYNSFIAFI